MLELPRRRFLANLIGLVAAPAVVRASSLMPVRGFVEPIKIDNVNVFDTAIEYSGRILNGLVLLTNQENPKYNGPYRVINGAWRRY